MATAYGDNEVLDNCVAAFKSQMDLLLAEMVSAATDPRPAAVYSGHDQLKMSLPAISVDINDNGIGLSVDIQGDKFEGSSKFTTHYRAMISIRIHTAYQEGYSDNQKIRRLINSIINWLQTHKDGPEVIIEGTANISYIGFNLGDISFNDIFEESLTLGGSIAIIVDLTISHTQL